MADDRPYHSDTKIRENDRIKMTSTTRGPHTQEKLERDDDDSYVTHATLTPLPVYYQLRVLHFFLIPKKNNDGEVS